MKWGKFDADFFYQEEIQRLLGEREREAILVYQALLFEAWRQDQDMKSSDFQLAVNIKMFARHLNMAAPKFREHMNTVQNSGLIHLINADNRILIEFSNYAKYKHKDAVSSKNRATDRPAGGLPRAEENRKDQNREDKTKEDQNRREKIPPTAAQGALRLASCLNLVPKETSADWANNYKDVDWIKRTLEVFVGESVKRDANISDADLVSLFENELGEQWTKAQKACSQNPIRFRRLVEKYGAIEKVLALKNEPLD